MATLAQTIKFKVIAEGTAIPPRAKPWSAYLNRDSWDDWGKYCTLFHLTIVDGEGKQQNVGSLKIGQRGLKPHARSPRLPAGSRKPKVPLEFEQLEEDFFSVGQDDSYYANLTALGNGIRKQVLTRLRDVARDKKRWKWAANEEVMKESLLRSVTSSTVEGQFRRMAQGHARVTSYDFSYLPPKRLGDGAPPFRLDFSVDPDSPIPTNVHVLIGRNGVGKTRLLSLMTKALVAQEASAKQSGRFKIDSDDSRSSTFANVVAVSFSAFDENDLLPDRAPEPGSLGFSYIGLRSFSEGSSSETSASKSPNMLAKEFVESLAMCTIGVRRARWKLAIDNLESDPVFRSAELSELIDADLGTKKGRHEAVAAFRSLSSGHKIVLLILTRLVEKVEERTLVLIDEPEAHLHPPLLSSMTRAISELLVRRNGVAIVATHSPIILQEVPKSCVWIIDRGVTTAKAERPSIETFAEAVGVLSREVFQLELSQSGYHHILAEMRRREATYPRALKILGNQIGAEGKAVLRAMYLQSDE